MTDNRKLVLDLSEEEQKALQKAGTLIFVDELDKTHYSLRELARIADISEPWARTSVKEGKIKATKDKRGRWQIEAAEVHRIRSENAEKQLNRAQKKKSGKKYDYKPPRQWAYDLTTKEIRKDKSLTPAARKTMLDAMERYKTKWETRAAARKAKIEANKAKTTT